MMNIKVILEKLDFLMLKMKQPKNIIVILLLIIAMFGLVYCMNKPKIVESRTILNQSKLDDPSIWYDEDNSLVWTRCHVGQQVEKQQCMQEAKMYTWQEAKQEIAHLNQIKWLGYSDWRLPHIDELQKIVHCSTGYLDQAEIPSQQNKKIKIQHGCKLKNYTRPTVKSGYFMQTYSDWYWSADVYQLNDLPSSNTVWGVYLSSGYVYDLQYETKGYIYAVRTQN